MEYTFTLYQVIAYLNKLENKNQQFIRVGDEDFIIFRGNLGDLMYKVGDKIKPLPIFNYLQEKWVLKR